VERLRIVAIEDQLDNREVMHILLNEWFDIASFPNGLSGLAAIRDSKPAAVLLDIAMPGMDGFAVIGEIRSDPNLRNLAVIAGYRTRDDG
jgi:CheY-like chemotaxis protein